MRYIIAIIIVCLITIKCLAQYEKFVIKSGLGYYTDVMAWYDGPILWLEGGYKFQTGFYLNGRVSMSTIDWKINGDIFNGYKTIALRQMIDITFARPISINGNNFLEPGLGFKLKREYHLLPDVSIEETPEQLILYSKYSNIFYEIGFTLCLDYYYQFSSGFFIGLRADTNVIWALGFEGLTFSPLLGFRF